MNLKKVKIISVFLVFALCFPFHFLYDLFPNFIFSIFLPVNESIWEHMKLIYTSFLLYGIIEFLILKRKNIVVNNYVFQLFLVPLIGIILYLLIYLPLYNLFGENMIISITLLFMIIVIEELISFFLLQSRSIKYGRIIGVFGIIIMYIVFVYLTYNPIHNYIFYDTLNKGYGLDIKK